VDAAQAEAAQAQAEEVAAAVAAARAEMEQHRAQAELARAAYVRELQMAQASQASASMGGSSQQQTPANPEPESEPAPELAPASVPMPVPIELPAKPPAATPLSPLDEALQQMKTGTLAFNTPHEMALLEPTLIHLVLSPRSDDPSVAALVLGPGPVAVEHARYSSTVEARLTGDGFQIDEVTAASQPVSQMEPTEWRWQVTPRTPGQRSLFLNVYAVVTLDGEKHERLIKTFEREFVVEVTFWRHPWMYLRFHPLVDLTGLALLAALSAGLVFYTRGYRLMKAAGARFSLSGTVAPVELFMSYSSKDRAWVEQLTAGLRASGRTVWMDVGGIAPAMRWSAQIVEALSRSKMVVLVGSQNSLHSHNVAKELSLASEQRKIILPLLIDAAEVPPELLYQLAGLQVARLRDPADIAEAVRTVLAALERVKPAAD
jgi:hypothetical protein